MNIINVTPQQLRRAAAVKERIDDLQAKLAGLLGSPVQTDHGGVTIKRRRMSRAGRARIAAAARARWARIRGNGPSRAARRPKRRMSPAVRARLAAIARARWRKVK